MAAQIKNSIAALQEAHIRNSGNGNATSLEDQNFIKGIKLVNSKTLEANGHKNKVYCVDVGTGDQHKRKAVSAGQDPQIIFWNLKKGVKQGELNISRNNKGKRTDTSWISTLNWQRSDPHLLALGNTDGVVRVYHSDVSSNNVSKAEFEKKVHPDIVNCVKFMHHSPELLLSCGYDWSLNVNNLESSKETAQVLLGHEDYICKLDVNENTPTLCITGSVDQTCRIWDFRGKQQEIGKIETESEVNDICFNPDGNCFAAALEDGTCHLYDVKFMGRPRFSYFKGVDTVEGGPISNVCFSAGGRLLVASKGRSVLVCNASPEESITGIEGTLFSESNKEHSSNISCLTRNHNDNKSFLTAGFDKKVKIWKTSKKKKR